MNDIFVFDTYALMEVVNSNKNYIPYLNSGMVINDFIFGEFCHGLLRDNVKHSEDYLKKAVPAILHVDPVVIKEAMRFRLKHKKRRMSMTDCVSYFMAINFGVKFLTGDKEFEHLPHVEFVK